MLILGIAWPRILRPFYQLWMNLGLALGWLNTKVIIAAMFFIIITPLGLCRRLLAGPTLHLSKDPDSDTYSIPAKERSREHFRWQF